MLEASHPGMGTLLWDLGFLHSEIVNRASKAVDVFESAIENLPVNDLNAMYLAMCNARATVANNDEHLSGIEAAMSDTPENQLTRQNYKTLVGDYAVKIGDNGVQTRSALATARSAVADFEAGDSFANLGVFSILSDIRAVLQGELNFIENEIDEVDVPGGADQPTIDSLESIENALNTSIQRINNF